MLGKGHIDVTDETSRDRLRVLGTLGAESARGRGWRWCRETPANHGIENPVLPDFHMFYELFIACVAAKWEIMHLKS